MNKRILSAAVAATLALGLTACGGSDKPAASDAPANSSAPSAGIAKEDLKIGGDHHDLGDLRPEDLRRWRSSK